MNWLQHVRKGKEADAQAAILSLGRPSLQCFLPMQIEAKRSGKQRRAEPVEEPILTRVLWLRGTAEDWQRCQGADLARAGVGSTTMFFPDASWHRYVAPWIDKCARVYADTKARIEAGERIAEFIRGEALDITDGPFSGEVMRFLSMVERAHDPHPLVRGEAEMMGRPVWIEVDPLAVRKRA